MNTENAQNIKSDLEIRVETFVNSKLKEIQLELNYLTVKELAYLLNCTERTIRRWNQSRKAGDKSVGIEFYQDNPKAPIKYPLANVYQYFMRSAI